MRLKVAVIGSGSMGMNHLRVLKDFNEEQVQIVGVAETYEPSLKQAVSRFHVPGYIDYREMVDDELLGLIREHRPYWATVIGLGDRTEVCTPDPFFEEALPASVVGA